MLHFVLLCFYVISIFLDFFYVCIFCNFYCFYPCSGLLRDVPECSGMFRNVPAFIDGQLRQVKKQNLRLLIEYVVFDQFKCHKKPHSVHHIDESFHRPISAVCSLCLFVLLRSACLEPFVSPSKWTAWMRFEGRPLFRLLCQMLM